jgi:hypothetical protein
MKLDTSEQLSNLVIMAMHRYLGDGFMCNDNSGKTVYRVVREFEGSLKYDAQSTCERIALSVLGGNLPHQVDLIKNLKFEK